ncbi:DUF5655 domain-containing protein [Nesterenkonia sp. Act20]|uniref:DUF5655 domain-containing protein n=1 Tax=Nesterenkonia sp. Act20 TaxID=1483432 RepID=UPI001C45EADD|nr:DUF5655 domain-containing protein [Nesterenkonia sp. Act20]
MTDLKLFKISDGAVSELPSRAIVLEKHLQQLMESNMEAMFGVRLVASEHSTGKIHRGRIDSLGLDENNSPVIFEYKRSTNENVINQGLFYLDWLVDHRGDFEKIVAQRLGSAASTQVDWEAPRLVCVANDFTRYDEYAVRQIDRNVELVRYRHFNSDLISIELVTTTSAEPTATARKAVATVAKTITGRGSSVSDLLSRASPDIQRLYEKYEAFALGLGDDVVKNTRNNYFAFRRIKNFACVEVHPSSGNLLIYLKVDPPSVELTEGFTRDVRNIGHFGTGELELRVTPETPWEAVESLTLRSYESS